MWENVMDFEHAWDLIRGEYSQVSEIIIAVIDGDFTNVNYHDDLMYNLIPNRPYEGWDPEEPGHGTSVAGVACALSNNSIGVAGAT
jgi:subtilisin family serine protease